MSTISTLIRMKTHHFSLCGPEMNFVPTKPTTNMRIAQKWNEKKSIKQKILILYWVFVCRNKGRLNEKKEKQRAKANTQDIGSVLQQHLSQINLLMHIICVEIAFFPLFLHPNQETASRVVASNQIEGKGFKICFIG